MFRVKPAPPFIKMQRTTFLFYVFARAKLALKIQWLLSRAGRGGDTVIFFFFYDRLMQISWDPRFRHPTPQFVMARWLSTAQIMSGWISDSYINSYNIYHIYFCISIRYRIYVCVIRVSLYIHIHMYYLSVKTSKLTSCHTYK